jgi:glycolate oxidase FAD binding subunit
VGLEGYSAEVDAAGAAVTTAVRQAKGRVEASEAPPGFWDAARDWPAPDEAVVVLRVATSLEGVREAVTAVGSDGSVVAQPGAGIVHIRAEPRQAPALLQRLRGRLTPEGSVIVERSPAASKTSLDVWGPLPQGFGLMQGLKASLDPRGILNPGRFVGGI